MAYAHGSVVLAPATFRSGRRPYLVVSNDGRPFFGSEYTVAVITTTERDAAVELTADRLTEGELARYPSYVNPWSLHVFQHDDIDRRVAQVGGNTLETVADRAHEFLAP